MNYRYRATLDEAKLGVWAPGKSMVVLSDYEWGYFYIISLSAKLTRKSLVRHARKTFYRHGYKMEVIDDDVKLPFAEAKIIVEFHISPLNCNRVTDNMEVRTTRLLKPNSRTILCNPAKMDFRHKVKRLAVLGEFISAWSSDSHAKFVDSRDLPKAWVDMLFAKGMIRRKLDDVNFYCPTVAGVLWHRQGMLSAAA